KLGSDLRPGRMRTNRRRCPAHSVNSMASARPRHLAKRQVQSMHSAVRRVACAVTTMLDPGPITGRVNKPRMFDVRRYRLLRSSIEATARRVRSVESGLVARKSTPGLTALPNTPVHFFAHSNVLAELGNAFDRIASQSEASRSVQRQDHPETDHFTDAHTLPAIARDTSVGRRAGRLDPKRLAKCLSDKKLRNSVLERLARQVESAISEFKLILGAIRGGELELADTPPMRTG